MSKRLRILLHTLGAGIVIVFVIVYVYPYIQTRVAQPLEVRSSDVSVVGYQYPIHMTQVMKIRVDRNRIVFSGYDITLGTSGSREYELIRPLPKACALYTEPDTTWALLDDKRNVQRNDRTFTVRTFHNRERNINFEVVLPMFNADPEWIALTNQRSSEGAEWVFLLSSSGWKHGEGSYLGFVEVRANQREPMPEVYAREDTLNAIADSLIQQYIRTGNTIHLVRLNAHGEHADGAFAEYYGYTIVENLLRTSVRCDVLQFLASAPSHQRRNLERAIAFEYAIDHENSTMQALEAEVLQPCPRVPPKSMAQLRSRMKAILN